MNKAIYPFEPIKTIPKLALALGEHEHVLRLLANQASTIEVCDMYKELSIKKGNKISQVFDAQEPLKSVQKRITQRILSRVEFPYYLQGSLKGCDYVKNAAFHTNKKIVICEDVEQFFPSVTANKVKEIWQNFFHFSEDVSALLTILTTKDGYLLKGASTSCYLANLVFWKNEPSLYTKLNLIGITYSRYVDDITVSSSVIIPNSLKTEIIAQIYGMIRKNGLSAKRSKHEIFPASKPQIVTKLTVNKKTSLNKKKRSATRSQVHHAINSDLPRLEKLKLLNQTAQSVGQLARFHNHEATKLKKQINSCKLKNLENDIK